MGSRATAFKPFAIKVPVTRTFTCDRCGKETTRRRMFCRRAKTADQVDSLRASLEAMALAWQPTMHRFCEARTNV